MTRPNAQNNDILLWLSAVAILLLPTICHIYWEANEALPFLATGLVVSVTLASLIFCCPWRWLRWLLFSILFAVSLFELTHILVYNGDLSSAGYIRSLFMTTPYEADGAVVRIMMQHIVFIIILVVVYLFVSVAFFLTNPLQSFFRWTFVISLLLLILYIVFSPVIISARPPLNIYAQMYEAFRQRNERKERVLQPTITSYSAKRAKEERGEEIYLLILDESLRYDHVSFHGENYRTTMPRMGQLPNMHAYTNFYTTGVFTMYAVPMFVTRSTPKTFTGNYQEYGIQQAFAEVGFKAIWLTNEAQLVSDGVSDYVARGAEIHKVKSDMDMPAVIDSLCAIYDKLFVIMHLWGNHQFYLNTNSSTSLYYPDITTTDAVHGEVMYNNSYDNSILCTDSMLQTLTDVLLAQECKAQWLFTSDHGEGPIGKNGGAHGYAHPTKEEYHVPLMVWYSDEYKEAYPDKIANMIRHKDEPVCADHIFWSVLDMAGIRIDSTLQQDGMSIFGDTLLPHQRTLLLPDGKSVMTLD